MADSEPKGKEATRGEVDYLPPTPPGSGSNDLKTAAPDAAATTGQVEGGARKSATTAARPSNTSAGDGRFERVGEMALHYDASSSELKALETRMQQLEHRLEQRDKVVRQSGEEVQAATEELHRTLANVETWRKEVEETRAKLRDRDRADIESLKATVKTLERLLDE